MRRYKLLSILLSFLSFTVSVRGGKGNGLEYVGRTLENLESLSDVRVWGNYAYVGGSGGIGIFDISDPSLPSCKKVYSFSHPGGRCFTLELVYPYLYVGTSNRFLILDISSPDNPQKLSEYFFPQIHDIIIQSNYAYLSCYWDRSVIIMDISDPSHPEITARCKVQGLPRLMGMKGHYLYVPTVGDSACLNVIDIEDPTNPQSIALFQEGVNREGVAIYGDYLYTIESKQYPEKGCGIGIFNISDPLNPKKVKFLEIGASPPLLRYKHYLFLNFGSLKIMDLIPDPLNPHQIGIFSNEHSYFPCQLKFIQFPYAYIGSGANPRGAYGIGSFFEILNISNISHPKKEGMYYVSTGVSYLDISGKYLGAVYANEGSGFTLLDISNPALPKYIGYIDYPCYQGQDGTMAFYYLFTVALSYPYAYVTYELKWNPEGYVPTGFHIIDISAPPNLKLLSSYSYKNYTDGNFPFLIMLRDSYVYLPVANEGIRIVDVSNPENPYLAGSFPDTSIHWLAPSPPYLYESSRDENGYAILRILDITQPTKPIEVGRFTPPSDEVVCFLKSIDNIGFVFFLKEWRGERGIYAVDFSNPKNPQILSTYYTGKKSYGFHISNHFLYYITPDSLREDGWYYSLRALDISDPYHIKEAGGYYDIKGFITRFTITSSGEYVYVPFYFWEHIKIFHNVIGGVKEADNQLHKAPVFKIFSSNPFRENIKLSFVIPQKEKVSLCIYDISGRLIKTLFRAQGIKSETKVISWDGRDDKGNLLPSGVYFIRLEAGGITKTEKVILIR